MTLAVEIWQRDQITTPGPPTQVAGAAGTIETGLVRTWRHVKNDYGRGGLNVPLTSTAEVAAATPGRLIKFVRDGTVRGCIVIGPRRFARLQQGEEVQQVLVIDGDGVMSVLNDARVPPFGGAGWSPWDRQRPWDWSNPALDVTSWVPATELWRQGDPADLSASSPVDVPRDQGRYAFGAPEGFADADAMWIFSSGYDGAGGTGGTGTLGMEPGISYLHKAFTVGAGTHARALTAGDDHFEFAIDGVKLIESAPYPADAWARSMERDVYLSAGTHTIRVKVENYDLTADGNLAAFIAAVHSVDPVNGTLGDVIVHTDDTWKALDYPASPPGFTATDIVLTLLAEVQAEGFLLDIDPSFSATTGTSGTMPILTDVTTTVGDRFGEMTKQLAAAWIDTRVNHDMTWDVWEKGVPGSASGVTYAAGVNIEELELDGDTTPISSLLVLGAEGYFVLGDDSAGRQEFADLSQLSRAEAETRGQVILDELSVDRWQATIAVKPTTGTDVPWDDFDIFDTVTVPDPYGTPALVECVALSYHEDINGLEQPAPEFGDLVLSREERVERQLVRLGVGGVDGRSPLVTAPGGGQAPSPSPLSQGGGSFGQVAASREIDFTRVATDTATTSLEKMVGAGSTVSEFAVKFDGAQAGSVSVLLKVNGTTRATAVMAAGATLVQVAGIGFAISKYTDLLTVSCTTVGFGFVATVMVS